MKNQAHQRSDSEHDESEPASEHNGPLNDVEHHEASKGDEETPPASRLPQQDDPSSAALAQPFTDDSPFNCGDAYMMLLDVAIRGLQLRMVYSAEVLSQFRR